jgi:hypothetical protein
MPIRRSPFGLAPASEGPTALNILMITACAPLIQVNVPALDLLLRVVDGLSSNVRLTSVLGCRLNRIGAPNANAENEDGELDLGK